MNEAGVSKDVLKAFVETSPVDLSPTAADLIALKQRGVPDDITTALLKRCAQIQAQQSQPNLRTGTMDFPFGPMDPESYSYFQYYYLYPRTLAYSYGRLAGYCPPGYCFGSFPGPGPFYSYPRGAVHPYAAGPLSPIPPMGSQPAFPTR